MRWSGRRRSGNVQDRRGSGTVGTGQGLAVGGGVIGIIIAIIIFLLGGDPGSIFTQGQEGAGPSTTLAGSVAEDEAAQFVSVVLATTEDVWTPQFEQMGRTYDKPILVLFSGSVATPGGAATSATGPFYSPQDESIYIDLAFFDELSRRFGAPGDFAQAYVIAHEVGHHIQYQLGILEQVSSLQRQVGQAKSNDLSVRLELQADFLAGVWAHYAERSLDVVEPGDIDEALAAAGAVGDDRIQQQAQGYVVPDSFTHGTSAQRARWFRLGYETGDLSQGNTFAAESL
ncbi:MAG: hypothetical protein GXX83_10400 [Gaiellales bacterium]|nr:hypothetical protein [Gaiellales bacterium]